MIDFEKELRKLKIFDEEKLKKYLSLVCKEYDGDDYSETHHVLPKSIYPEYKYNSDNIVRLVYKDHIIAHELLYGFLNTHGMMMAYHMMSGKDPNNLCRGENNPSKRDDDVREKISIAKKGKSRPDMHGKAFFGADESTIEDIRNKSSKVHHNMVCVVDEYGNRFKVSTNDERYISGELVSFNLGKERPNSASKNSEVMNKIMTKRIRGYEKFSKFTFLEMVDFLVESHNKGKNIFANKKPFSKNYSGYVKRTNFDQDELKKAVVQRLEKDSTN